jgi:hypothetical protein
MRAQLSAMRQVAAGAASDPSNVTKSVDAANACYSAITSLTLMAGLPTLYDMCAEGSGRGEEGRRAQGAGRER